MAANAVEAVALIIAEQMQVNVYDEHYDAWRDAQAQNGSIGWTFDGPSSTVGWAQSIRFEGVVLPETDLRAAYELAEQWFTNDDEWPFPA